MSVCDLHNKLNSHRVILLAMFLAMSLACSIALAADDGKIESLERWSNIFANEKIALRFPIAAIDAPNLPIGWSATLESAVIVRRETALVNDPKQGPILTTEFSLPEGEAKTILPMAIFVTHHGKETLAKRLWILPRNPFNKPMPSLATREILLFDPKQTTTLRLEETQLKFRVAKNVDSFSDFKEGVLLIGEGVSFREFRALPQAILQAAARGVKVICLAPVAGSISLPKIADHAGDEERYGDLRKLSLRQSDVIADFDKRLDYRDWRGNAPVVATTFIVSGKENALTAEAKHDSRGWSWIEADFVGGGRLILCGFSILDHWESSPTPRHVFWHVLSQAVRESAIPGDVEQNGRIDN